MATAFSHISYTEKERVGALHFPSKDVLHSPKAQKKRFSLIEQAIDAGNYAQFKVMIIFEDSTEVREVETTIWDSDQENVYLKNNISIPIHRIHKLRFI